MNYQVIRPEDGYFAGYYKLMLCRILVKHIGNNKQLNILYNSVTQKTTGCGRNIQIEYQVS